MTGRLSPKEELQLMDLLHEKAEERERMVLPADPVDEVDADHLEASAEAGGSFFDKLVDDEARSMAEEIDGIDHENL